MRSERLRNGVRVTTAAIVLSAVGGARITVAEREFDGDAGYVATLFSAAIHAMFHDNIGPLTRLTPRTSADYTLLAKA